MTDTEILAAAAAVIAPVAAGAMKFGHWAITYWGTIRRDEITAANESAALNRSNDTRIADQQTAAIDRIANVVNDHTARDVAAQARVEQAVVALTTRVDTIAEWRQRTPVEHIEDPPSRPSTSSERRRKAAQAAQAAQGYRAPKPGAHND